MLQRVPLRKAAQLAALWASYGPYFYQRREGSDSRSADPLKTTPRAMADLSGYLLIDASTGTVLSASTCYLVADDAFSVGDWDAMESFSDSEMCDFAKQRGKKLSDVVRLRPQLPGEV